MQNVSKNDPPLSAFSAKAALHAVYLKRFLADGFEALQQLKRLDAKAEQEAKKHGENVEPRLAGFGAERAAKLFGACQAEPSLLSAVYWIVCAKTLLNTPLDATLAEKTLAFVQSCLSAGGGFSPHPEHQPNILSTQSGVQILILLDRKDVLDGAGPSSAKGILQYVRSLRLPDGSYCGRRVERPEGDCRFVYAALCTMVLLGEMRVGEGDDGANGVGKAVDWLLNCQNFDGGFGCRPGGECESHAGHTFCCLAALALAGSLNRIQRRDHTRLVRWLCDRQCPDGGLNGRPGKAPDCCYTWWTLASVELLRAHHDRSRGVAMDDFFRLSELRTFVLSCMNASGGLGPHPGDSPDPFHTFFGFAGLSLIDQSRPCLALEGDIYPMSEFNPAVAMPTRFVDNIFGDIPASSVFS